MNDPRYQEAQKKQLDETIEQAFDNFMVISVAYLMTSRSLDRSGC